MAPWWGHVDVFVFHVERVAEHGFVEQKCPMTFWCEISRRHDQQRDDDKAAPPHSNTTKTQYRLHHEILPEEEKTTFDPMEIGTCPPFHCPLRSGARANGVTSSKHCGGYRYVNANNTSCSHYTNSYKK